MKLLKEVQDVLVKAERFKYSQVRYEHETYEAAQELLKAVETYIQAFEQRNGGTE